MDMIINFAIGYHCKPLAGRTVCVYSVINLALSSVTGGKDSHIRLTAVIVMTHS